jgi:hypothetical protein
MHNTLFETSPQVNPSIAGKSVSAREASLQDAREASLQNAGLVSAIYIYRPDF